MELPVHFPSDADVIAEEAARFRALTPAERIRSLRGLLNAGVLLMRRSPKASFLHDYTLGQENLTRETIKEFLRVHANDS